MYRLQKAAAKHGNGKSINSESVHSVVQGGLDGDTGFENNQIKAQYVVFVGVSISPV